MHFRGLIPRKGVIHRIHKWPPRGTIWTRAQESEVGKTSVKSTTKKSWRRPALRRLAANDIPGASMAGRNPSSLKNEGFG